MPTAISKNSFDFQQVTPVAVIASFSQDGHVVPLYVRIDGERYKIQSSYLKTSLVINTFQCEVDDNGVYKPLVLNYHPVEGVWTTPSVFGFHS